MWRGVALSYVPLPLILALYNKGEMWRGVALSYFPLPLLLALYNKGEMWRGVALSSSSSTPSIVQ